MIYGKTELAGAFLLELEPVEDERGFFARSFSRDELEARGLKGTIAQCNVSYNSRQGTLRGMHYQVSPHQEVKLVRCTRGAIYDVIVDLRPDSRTFRGWAAFELSADNRRTLYVPETFAHGFLTLTDDSEVSYMLSETYHPESARGLRWDDPALGISWPSEPVVVSARDASFPFLEGTRSRHR